MSRFEEAVVLDTWWHYIAVWSQCPLAPVGTDERLLKMLGWKWNGFLDIEVYTYLWICVVCGSWHRGWWDFYYQQSNFKLWKWEICIYRETVKKHPQPFESPVSAEWILLHSFSQCICLNCLVHSIFILYQSTYDLWRNMLPDWKRLICKSCYHISCRKGIVLDGMIGKDVAF